MSDDSSGDEKPIGFDISKLEMEMSDEERAEADERLSESLRGLASRMSSIAAAQATLRSLGISGVIADMVSHAEKLNSIVVPAGLRHLNMGLDNTPLGVSQAAMDTLREDGHFARLAATVERQSRILESLSIGIDSHLGRLPSVMRDSESACALDISRTLDLPRIGVTFAASDISKYGSIFDSVNALHSLGLGEEFGDRFSLLATGLTEKMQALGQIGNIAARAQIGFGLSGNIEEMLARSLAAQEAMLAEYRESAAEAKTEARFHRRMVTLHTIINVLLLFLNVALAIEDRLADDDATLRENTEAVLQMQLSFDALAAQVQRMNEVQEAATEQERAADAAIANLLREIADSLTAQAEAEGHDASKPPLAHP